ncbi:MAG: CinA family nicotinamide mononucleotide deamidase-related protein [Sporichthyaceae bacterium]
MANDSYVVDAAQGCIAMTSTRVELITVGDELLSGLVLNSNVGRVADALSTVGLALALVTDVGDDVAEIAAAVRLACSRADVVLCSGGLGPTSDDLTRDALAVVAGVELYRDAGVEADVRARYAAWGLAMPPSAVRQADVPAGAQLLHNPRGSAPGLRMRVGSAQLFAMPGVPSELAAMLAQVIAPILATEYPGLAPANVTLRVALMGESTIADRLTQVQPVAEGAGVRFAYLPSVGDVRVRLSGPAEAVARAAASAADALGPAAYSADGHTLDVVLHDLLRARGATVAVAESLTGGLVGAALTEAAGASATFLGGAMVYATEAKADLGVGAALLAERGPVDADVAGALAQAVRGRFGATYGVATTGVAGPDPVGEHPAGTVFVAVAGPERTRVLRHDLPPRRDFVRALTVVAALDLLRRELLGLPDHRL